jgi:hypothetical protein
MVNVGAVITSPLPTSMPLPQVADLARDIASVQAHGVGAERTIITVPPPTHITVPPTTTTTSPNGSPPFVSRKWSDAPPVCLRRCYIAGDNRESGHDVVCSGNDMTHW